MQPWYERMLKHVSYVVQDILVNCALNISQYFNTNFTVLPLYNHIAILFRYWLNDELEKA